MMVAATALFASCNPDNGEGTGTGNNGGNTEKPFYGFTLDGADVTAIGGDEYILQMYNDDRLVAAQVAVPNVVEGVFPEGTYTLVEGSVVNNYYLTGSYYQNYSQDNGFYMLATSGSLEIKHTKGGIRATVYMKGVDMETGSTKDDVECRYEGELVIYDNSYPVIEESAAAYYLGEEEGVHQWELTMWLDLGDPEVDYVLDLYVLTETGFEAGIPSGKYPIVLTAEAGTVLPAYEGTDGYFYGSMIVAVVGQQQQIADLVLGGELNVVNNGNGTYKIDVEFINYYYLPNVVSYSGEVALTDASVTPVETLNVSQVEYYYVGGGRWYAYVYDLTYVDAYYGSTGAIAMLEVYCAEDSTFADGIPAGTYTVADTCAPFTIGVCEVDSEGGASGSMIVNSNNEVVDLVFGGAMVIGEGGTFELAFEGYYSDWAAEFDGEANFVDASGVAPAAKAPMKDAVKMNKTVFGNKDVQREFKVGRIR